MFKIFIRGLKKIGTGIGIFCVPITFMDVIGHPSIVNGSSMEPTLNGSSYRWWGRDIVWLSKLYRNPTHNDIFAFSYPKNVDRTHIKRVGKLPEETVCLKQGDFYSIPLNHLWMISDNPERANDSNIYGPVNKGLLKGKATLIIWPPNRWRKL